jgi:DNA-directed RNA polymerase sigma subunit (sigma70/sigma32)
VLDIADYGGCTFAEVAAATGESRQRIQQIEALAARKVAKRLWRSR